jgi:hypothetical protein
MTRKYIGTKVISAFYESKGPHPLGEEGYAVIYEDGYRSWSPKAAFETAYRAIEGEGQALTFGDALHMLKLGKKVARAGWNGKGMWLVMVPGSHVPLRDGTPYHAALNTSNDGQSHVTINGHIDMRTASGEMQPGWLASQTDMLASDWMVVP